jgi:transcriptional regulator with XRE-family HTH domain
MANDAYGATIAKRRLAKRLIVMRTRAGLSFGEADDRLGWSRGRLQRIERNDWRLPDLSRIRDLARIYDATEAELAELDELGRVAKERHWGRGYEKVLGSVSEFAGLENDAARISVYMPQVVPPLLQTRPYMEARLRSRPGVPDWREKSVAFRLRRQQILDRADGTAPRLVAVLTEGSLRYQWGSKEDRHAQVMHLVGMSRRPNIDLRLVRFADGLYPGVTGAVNIFDFPDDDEPAVVFLETDFGPREVGKADQVTFYKQAFPRVRDGALAAAATRNHLEELADTME